MPHIVLEDLAGMDALMAAVSNMKDNYISLNDDITADPPASNSEDLHVVLSDMHDCITGYCSAALAQVNAMNAEAAEYC